jgi:nucleotide-binding universal stress UspA family protein
MLDGFPARRGVEMTAAVPRIVVGIDGTDRSVGAVRWAAAEVRRRGGELVVVYAFGTPLRPGPLGAVRLPLSADGAVGHAVARLKWCLAAAFQGRPPVRVHSVCDGREPAQALLAQARGAGLLVLTGHADPDRAGLVLGRTVRTCLAHAPCPVVVLLADTANHVTRVLDQRLVPHVAAAPAEPALARG